MNTPALPAAAQPALPTPAKTPQIFDARQRIQVATPTYDFSLTEYYHGSLRQCLASPTAHFRSADGSVGLDAVISGRLNIPNDSHIDRARNVLSNIFVNDHLTDWILWIDADIQFSPADIARMFVHAQHGRKFVCGLYAMKCLKPTFVANVAPGAKVDPTTGLIELQDGGTGFMLLHRDVFLALQKHPRVLPYTCASNSPQAGATHYPYFQSGTYGPPDPKTGHPQWLSEDWMICRLWQELGGKVWGDTNIKLRHFGRMLYPPQVDELEDAVVDLLKNGHPGLNPAKLTAALTTHAERTAARSKPSAAA
jgi:hypothetical protein